MKQERKENKSGGSVKNKNEKDWKVTHSLFSLKKYLIFFILVAFVVTCSFQLFLSSMRLDGEAVRERAPITFLNVMFISLIFYLFDTIRRKITIERPVKRILEGTRQITKGNFNTRIEPVHQRANEGNEFDVIINGLNKLAEELSGVETLRTDFIANVSHELKTPLAVIQNYGVMLQEPDLPEDKRVEYAKSVTEASRRLADLISNILKLNRLENQQIFPETREYNLGEQLCECLLYFEDAWEKKNLEIETDIAEDVVINADYELLSLVWNNLFSNAVKFTEPEGKISVGLRQKDKDVIVIVADTGCGMSEEVGKHIFEKFYQGDTSHASQGNGLGLALVKRIIDITGGEISIESTLGKGSTFRVRL